jgi:hypothetical protein
MPEFKKDYAELTFGGTGSAGEAAGRKIITCPFDKYEVKIALNEKNEFVEIIEIKINKDFMSYKQKARLKSSIDEGEFYDKE